MGDRGTCCKGLRSSETPPSARWTAGQMGTTHTDPCPAPHPNKYNSVKGANRSLGKMDGVIRANEINMHRVINTH